MAVSNFYGTNALVAHSPIARDLQQFRGFESGEHFDGKDFFAQDDRVEQVRARTFIESLDLNIQEKSKPVLGSLLKQILQLSDSEKDGKRLEKISQAFYKQQGYLSRLFSHESWEEWTENRTALGKVASQFRDCLESRAQVGSFTKKLDEEVIQKATKEAEALLKSLGHRDAAIGRSFSVESESSCVTGLALGTFGSLLIQHPLPLLMGLSQCFPGVNGQLKVGSEFQVNTYTLNHQAWPTVASFSNDNFIVAWESLNQDGSGVGIYGQLFYKNGTYIGNEFQVNTYTDNYQDTSSVTSLNNGNFVVTWESRNQDGDRNGVYGQIFNITGIKIGNEFQINTYTINDQDNPSVTGLNSGNFIVTWHSNGLVQDGSGYGVYGQIFNETGRKILSEFQINTYTINDQINPRVASLINGNFVVVWESTAQDGFDSGIFGQLFDGNVNKTGSEFRVNSYAIDNQWWPSVAGLRNGNFIVAWASNWQDGDLNGVFGQLFNENGNKVGNEFQVNTEIVNDQLRPAVASLSNDHFVVAWESEGGQDGSNGGIFGQLFDENGSKVGNEFQINNYTIDDQKAVAIAGFQDGNFIMTWGSFAQDGSEFGIYGQIFHDNFTLSSSTSTTSTSQTTTTTIFTTSTSQTTTTTIFPPSNPLSSSSTIMRSTTEKSTASSTTSTSNLITSNRIPVTSGVTSKIFSPSPNRNNGLFWLGFLLGGVACVTCFVQAGYLFYKSRRREEGGDTIELREKNITRDDAMTDSSEGAYANVPKRESLGPEYANRPKRESLGPEYANRPKSAPLGEGYGNVADVEDSE